MPAAVASPTRYIQGTCNETPEPVMATEPEYSPGGGNAPNSDTVTVVDCPAAIVTVGEETVGARPPRALVTASVRFTEALPLLAMASLLETGAASESCTPKDNDERYRVSEVFSVTATVTLVATAAAVSRRPAPNHRTSAGVGGAPDSAVVSSVRIVCAAVFTSADLICAGVNPGCACFTSAAAPATMGAEKLVPSAVMKPSGLCISAHAS